MSIVLLLRSFTPSLSFLVLLCLTSDAVVGQGMTPLVFVSSFVDDLGNIQRLRDKAANDATEAGSDYTTLAVGCIRNSTSLALELRAQAQRYRDINMGGNFSTLGPSIGEIWMKEAQLMDQVVSNCKSLLNTSDALTQMQIFRGEMAQFSAERDYLDKIVFEAAMPMALISLIANKTDSNGKASILSISKMERVALLTEIESDFGIDLNTAKPSYLVGSAQLLKRWLQNKSFKASDDVP